MEASAAAERIEGLFAKGYATRANLGAAVRARDTARAEVASIGARAAAQTNEAAAARRGTFIGDGFNDIS